MRKIIRIILDKAVPKCKCFLTNWKFNEVINLYQMQATDNLKKGKFEINFG